MPLCWARVETRRVWTLTQPAKAEYQLRDMKGEKSGAVILLIKTNSTRGQTGGPWGGTGAPVLVVTAVLPNCFHMRWVLQSPPVSSINAA